MDPQITARYHAAILAETHRRYALAPGQLRPLDAYESIIFEFERAGAGAILRLSHSLRRSPELIHGEVDWINYLAGHGVGVARALPSPAGRLVEAIPDGQGGHFLATAFVKAHGRSPWDLGWTPAILEAYGRLLGQMHALAQGYAPADPAWRRPEWDAAGLDFPERYLPAGQAHIKAQYRALVAELQTLPRDSAGYGLIHQDAHGTNFLVDAAGRLTLFDFDECAYSWFINDIAIALFYTVLGEAEPAALTARFCDHFLRGYRSAHHLDPHWFRQIPRFLKLRELELYAVIYRDFDVDRIDAEWAADFMRGRRARIERAAPYIDFDFAALAGG